MGPNCLSTYFNLPQILHNNVGTGRLQPLPIVPSVDTDHATEATVATGDHPGHGVLDHNGVLRWDPQTRRRLEKDGRVGFAGETDTKAVVAVDDCVENRSVDAGRSQHRRRIPARGDQGHPDPGSPKLTDQFQSRPIGLDPALSEGL